MKRYGFIFIILLAISCRKDVNVKLPEYKSKLIIESWIEPGQPAQALISTSAPYFGDFDFSNPTVIFVKGAFVTVTDGSITDTLKEVLPGQGFYYSGDNLVGQIGKTYTITVRHSGKEYSAQTSLRNPVKLDSLFFKWEKDSLGFIWQHFKEPAGLGNYYRWQSKRLNVKYGDKFFAGPLFSVFDDKFIDGKEFDFSYDRGPQPYDVQKWRDDPNRNYYRVGDTVAVKFSHIGKAEYDFWNTYYQNKASNSNPFSAPVNIKSMFGNNQEVIGCFVGYSFTLDTIIIKTKP
jgi:hypothetical protein